MSAMLKILMLCNRLKEVTNSYVLSCLGIVKNCTYLSAVTCLIVMGLSSN